MDKNKQIFNKFNQKKTTEDQLIFDNLEVLRLIYSKHENVSFTIDSTLTLEEKCILVEGLKYCMIPSTGMSHVLIKGESEDKSRMVASFNASDILTIFYIWSGEEKIEDRKIIGLSLYIR